MVNFTVKHYGLVSGATTDITNDIVAIPLFTDTGSGEVNTAVVTLSGDGGKYVTSSPIIDQFDQIWIQATDDAGNAFGRTGGGMVYEVRKIIPQETKDGGNKVEIQCVGLEANMQVIDYITPWWFTDSFTVGKDIGAFYNAVRGTNQPLLLGNDDPAFNKLPNWTTNIYDFGLNEDKCYNRLMEVVDKLGSSVDAGGALDFYDVGFTNAINTMQINIFSSGSNPANPKTITNTNAVNIGESKGGIDSQLGSLIASWGANGLGSLPTGYSKFASKEYFYPLYKQWDNSVTYPVGAKIQYKGLLYQALAQNLNKQPDINPGSWQQRTRAFDYGNSIPYSPWTTAAVNAWRNSGSNLSNQGNSGTEPFGHSMWDGNIVLNNDTSVFRFPVDVISTSADLIKGNATYKLFLYSNTTFYRGFRVLCLGLPTIQADGTYFGYTAGSASTAKDVNGNFIKNSILQYDGTKWVVLYTAQTNMMCSHIYEGLVYQYDTTIPGAWGAIGGFAKGNDCFHPYDSITQVAGVETDPTFILNTNTAVQVKYTWLLQPIVGYTDTNDNYYKIGAWINFRFPFPHNNVTSTGYNVGLLYGGSITTGQEPATLDSQNMHYTHDGNRGFNNVSSEDYGQLQSLNFDMKLDYKDQITNLAIVGEANFKMRCFIIDTEDNVVYQDFVIPFNGNWEAVELPLSGFAIYRGVQPLWGPLDVLIPPAQVSATNVFNWRNIKNIAIQTQESYDSSGRYSPIISRYNNPFQASTLGRYIVLTIDSFRFAKPLLAITPTVGDRLIQPDFLQRPSILFYDQLLSDAKAELEKSKFRHKEYDITTTMAFDIQFGDSFFYENSRIVSDSDNGANTIKLVAKRIEYSITKAENGQGGALRTIVGIKRFT